MFKHIIQLIYDITIHNENMRIKSNTLYHHIILLIFIINN